MLHHHCLEECGLGLKNVDQTHLVSSQYYKLYNYSTIVPTKMLSHILDVNSGSGLDEELDEVVVLSPGGQVKDRVLQRRLRVLHLSLGVLETKVFCC